MLINPSAPVDPTKAEAELLRDMILAGGTAYSEGTSRDRLLARKLSLMGYNGMVTFLDAASGGWERGMWGAALTCVGRNAAYRYFGYAWEQDSHVSARCSGVWQPDGTCDSCTALRELDARAWEVYAIVTTDELPRARLYCVEHGFLRARHVTTTKTCPLAGTVMHDSGLLRM